MATRLQRLRREPVSETFPFAGPQFRRLAPWLLGLVALLSLATRAHPAFRYAVWGSDSGEYHFLTRQLVDTGRILFDYEGWGIAYPYFPGMYVVSGAAHAVMGIDLFHVVQGVVPALTFLLPVLLGLFAYRVTSDPRTAIVAGGFVAVAAPLVITTSHAMPGTLGILFMLGLFALLPNAYRDRRHAALLALVVVALVLSHHLTTYFAIGALAFSTFLRELLQRRTDRERLLVEVPLLVLLIGITCIWWLAVSTPFRERIVTDALQLDPWLTALLFAAPLVLLPVVVIAKRRATDWVHVPRYPGFQRQAVGIASTFIGVAALIVVFILTRVPGTQITVGWPSLWYTLPTLAFLAFVPLGMRVARFYRHGTLMVGWTLSVLASLVFAIVTSSRVLFPYRHVDYLLLAMAPLLAIGMLMVYDQTIAARMPRDRARVRQTMIASFLVLLVVSAIFSLPPRESVGGFEEGITDAELAAVHWVAQNVSIPPGTTMAADHRISSILWGYAGVHPTWDAAYDTYHSEDPIVALVELQMLEIPIGGERRIDYVYISPVIEQGVTLVQWENAKPMTRTAVAKFEDDHYFERIYDARDVRIYRVKWDELGLATPTG